MILLNSPHNPTGHVLSAAELAEVAAVAVEHDLLVVTDEVYEHLLFDGRRHVPIATLPGMAERTLTISSAGKTFSVTGWKIGWADGPGGTRRGGRRRSSSSSRTRGARPSSRRWRGRWPCPTSSSRAWRRACRPAGTFSPRGCSRPASPSAARAGRISWWPTPRRWGTTTPWPCASTCRGSPASWLCRSACSTTIRGRGVAGPVRRVQATRGPRRGVPPVAAAAPLSAQRSGPGCPQAGVSGPTVHRWRPRACRPGVPAVRLTSCRCPAPSSRSPSPGPSPPGCSRPGSWPTAPWRGARTPTPPACRRRRGRYAEQVWRPRRGGLRRPPAGSVATAPSARGVSGRKPWAASRFGWPLRPAPRVVRRFAVGPHPWSPGHRGVDLAGSAGQAVLAAGAGVVTFTGRGRRPGSRRRRPRRRPADDVRARRRRGRRRASRRRRRADRRADAAREPLSRPLSALGRVARPGLRRPADPPGAALAARTPAGRRRRQLTSASLARSWRTALVCIWQMRDSVTPSTRPISASVSPS